MPRSVTKTSTPKRVDASGLTQGPVSFDLVDVEFLAAAAAEGEKPSVPKVSINAYNGGVMRPSMPGVPLVVDLAGTLVETDFTPLFRDHDSAHVLGQGTVAIAASNVKFVGTLCGQDADVNPILEAASKGFKWKASLGANLAEVEWIASGQTAKANGKTFKGPVYIARKAVITEVSITARGADTRTSVRIAASAAEGTVMDPKFVEWLKASGFENPEELSDVQLKPLERAWKAEASGAEDDPTPAPQVKFADGESQLQAMADRASAELQRQADIQALLDEPRYRSPKATTLTAQAIKERWDVTRTKLALLEATYPQAGPAIHTHDHKTMTLNAKAMECALLLACHAVAEDKLLKQYGEPVLEAAASRQYRYVSLQNAMIACVRAAGMHVPDGPIRQSDFDIVVEADKRLRAAAIESRMQAGGEISSMSLSGILSNVANKAMLETFESLESAVQFLAAMTDTNNFKPFTRYRLDSSGAFGVVGPDGELKHIKLVEGSYTNRLQTEGGMFGLTRQSMIDDDMGAFLQLPMLFGELAKHAIEQQCFTVLLGNASNFFGVANKNYLSGAGSVLSISSLNDARAKFRNLKGPGGRFIMMSPQQLVVPPALETLANALYAAEYVNETTTANKQSPNLNPHKNKYAPVVSPYLGTESGITGASDTAWYLTVRPTQSIAPLLLAFLQGKRAPVIESSETSFNTLGMQWRSYIDFGVSLFEPRAGVKSAGA